MISKTYVKTIIDTTTVISTAAEIDARGEVFGTPGVNLAQLIYRGDDTVQNTVAMLIIDDNDPSHNGRRKLLDATIKQVGLLFLDNTVVTGTKTGVVMLDSSYQTN